MTRIPLIVALLLLAAPGCKKAAAPTAPAVAPATPTPPAASAPALPPVAPAGAAAGTAPAVAATGGPDAGVPPAVAPGVAATEADALGGGAEAPSAPAPPERSPRLVCVRACNKAQQCGSARGGVSACVQSCLEAFAGTAEDERRLAVGFRAQDGCADRPCAGFEGCVAERLVSSKAMAAAPPMTADKAHALCPKLCEREKLCHKESFDRRPGGMPTCVATCEQVLRSPDPAVVRPRALMLATAACLVEAECPAFEACVRKSVILP